MLRFFVVDGISGGACGYENFQAAANQVRTNSNFRIVTRLNRNFTRLRAETAKRNKIENFQKNV